MIVNAAILKDGVIYTNKRHHLIIQAHPYQFFLNCKQGFVTSNGEFVNREDALKIAIENNQLIVEPRGNKLYSEDVW